MLSGYVTAGLVFFSCACFAQVLIPDNPDQVLTPGNCPLFNYKLDSWNGFPAGHSSLTTGWVYYNAMSDEFDGTLNTGLWSVFDDDCHSMSPRAYFRNTPDNVKTEQGQLKLKVKHETNGFSCDSTTVFYSSGYIGSIPTIQYGYIEIMCYLPNELSLNPAFWLFGQDDPYYYDEIDVFEKFLEEKVSNQNLMNNFYHNLDRPGTLKLSKTLAFPSSFVGDTIVFAIEWLPEELNYYINGTLVSPVRYSSDAAYYNDTKSVYTCTDFKYALPQWVQLSLALNTAIDTLPDPVESFTVFYLRSYKLREGYASEYWPSAFSMTDPYIFRVHQSLRLGGVGHTAIIPADENITVWARDSILLDKGFQVSGGTQFTARTIVTQDSLFIP